MDKVDTVFRALADRTRRHLLDLLHANDGQTLNELCQHLDITRQAVTKHLGLLEAANLVVIVWRGRKKLHYINPVPIHEMAERWIGKFERDRLRALQDLKKRVELSSKRSHDEQAELRVRQHQQFAGKSLERSHRSGND